LHWYHVLVDADCTQLRGATSLPSVAELHHANVAVQPAGEELATHAPSVHR
jgi:hypothetical protein